MTELLKKLYRYIDSHAIGFVHLWMFLLIPCAISRHFAAWMVTANIAIWLLVMYGNRKGWRDDER